MRNSGEVFDRHFKINNENDINIILAYIGPEMIYDYVV